MLFRSILRELHDEIADAVADAILEVLERRHVVVVDEPASKPQVSAGA